MSGPDAAKVGTDFGIIALAAMESTSGRVSWCPLQVLDFYIPSVSNCRIPFTSPRIYITFIIDIMKPV